MAISKILHMKQAKSGYMAKHLANGLKYIMNPKKTEDGRYVSGSNCTPENALEQMLETKRHFGKMDKRQGYHFIISFAEELTEETAFEIVGEFVREYLGSDYEAVYAIHNDTDHIHGHIIFNSVRCTDGYKYDYPKGEWENRIQSLVNRLCEEHGLSVLDMEKVKENRRQRQENFPETEVSEKRLSGRNLRIKRDVDQAVEDADTYEEFLELLKCMGYELSGRKHLAVREAGAKRCRRLDSLGEEYTEEMLRFRIAGLPVLKPQEPIREEKLFYIFIPYRNRHLTRHQKECFIRKYRAGKIRTGSRTWAYRANLRALKNLQDEYAFWTKYHIRSTGDIRQSGWSAEEKLQEIREAKEKLARQKKSYQAVLNLLHDLDSYEMEAGLYKEGYPEFSGEFREYEKICGRLAAYGYSVSDARKIESYFQTEFQKLEDQRKTALKEKRIAKNLEAKVCEAERNRKEQKKELQKGRL